MSHQDDLFKVIQKKHKDTVFEALGISIEAYDPEVVISLQVDHRHLQHAGIVHGGVYVLLAESAASIAGAFKVDLHNYDIFGMEINANHLKPTLPGQKIFAKSKLIHQGRSTMIYGVDITNEVGGLVSISRCTLAVRKK